jgi:glutathione S-transferase
VTPEASQAPKSSKQRSRAQIEADLAATRERLAGSIEELIGQVHPKRVKQRQVAAAKSFIRAEMANAKAQIVYPNGELRSTRLAGAGGAIAGFVTFLLVVRRIVRGGKHNSDHANKRKKS